MKLECSIFCLHVFLSFILVDVDVGATPTQSLQVLWTGPCSQHFYVTHYSV